MKLTDLVIDFLAKKKIKHVFGLTGGGAVHLFDTADKHPDISVVFTHHEQAAALASVAYARITGNIGATIVTTGPGGTNTITGVLSAWQDSIPCIFISGQSRKDHVSHGRGLRQLGTQEFDIVSLVRTITKYAVLLDQPEMILYHLEKAFHIATTGRPGPVWIDIPLDFQWADIDPSSMKTFVPDKQVEKLLIDSTVVAARTCWNLIARSKRPLFLLGYGIRLAHAEHEIRQLIELSGIPFVTTWTASDLFESCHPLNAGRIGIAGQRGANMAIQNCDLLISIGSHLSIPITGTLFNAFAREAKVVMVDIDEKELDFQTVHVDYPFQCDARDFLATMISQRHDGSYVPTIDTWLQKISNYRRYNDVPHFWKVKSTYVNPYVFMDILSDKLKGDEVIVVDGGGTNLYISFQAFRVKGSQRLTVSSAIASMGTGLPESVGACFANGKKTTICTIGDGSMQFNIQELETIVHHNLPVKIFVMNNRGYLAIRHTQAEFLNGNFVGSSPEGGTSLPDFINVARAYRIKAIRVKDNLRVARAVQWALKQPGPALVELVISPDQKLIATQGFDHHADGTSSVRPLEDMAPYLDRKEFYDNMIIKPWKPA